jgi:hypothetical protein
VCSKKSTNWLANIILVARLVFKFSNGFDEGIIYLCTNIYISHILCNMFKLICIWTLNKSLWFTLRFQKCKVSLQEVWKTNILIWCTYIEQDKAYKNCSRKKYTLYNDNNENTVILENCRKKIKFGLITTEKYMLKKFDCGLQIEMSSATRDG